MSYAVKLAIFPPWKAPVPYETLAPVFLTIAEATEAGEKALAPIIERELSNLASDLQPRIRRTGKQRLTAFGVPESSVHGYLIFNEAGVEIFNWTTLDVAVGRAAEE
ncbi:MAG: hypothetical protein K2P80_05500 [Beijerinckiaceae bacterium]|nr:hypothetical protein [Beijerinckiaceae bacterium]